MLWRKPKHPALVPLVEGLWIHEAQLSHELEQLVPNGRMQLLINLDADSLRDFDLDGQVLNATGAAVLQGPRRRPVMIETAAQRLLCGVSFKPGATAAFVRIPAHELAERVVDIGDVWAVLGRHLKEELLAASNRETQLDLLERRLVGSLQGSLDPRTEVACAMLNRGVRVAAVAKAVNLSPRQLIQLFQRHVGITPKVFSRIERVQHVLQRMDADWAAVAADHGFADQAHLVREFKTFTGTTPNRYAGRNHAVRTLRPII